MISEIDFQNFMELLKNKQNLKEFIEKKPEIFRYRFNNNSEPYLHMLWNLLKNDIDYYDNFNLSIGRINIYDLKILNIKDNNGKTIKEIIDDFLNVNNDNLPNRDYFIKLQNKLKWTNGVFNLLRRDDNNSLTIKQQQQYDEIKTKLINNENNININLEIIKINEKLENILKRLENLEEKNK
jgi:hypothetical protein